MTRPTEDEVKHSAARQSYPEDRFDRLQQSGRVGAHRVTARPRYIWQYLIAGLLGFAVLTTIGILVVQNTGGSGKLPLTSSGTSSGSAQPSVTAELDPEATIAILNGTPTENLAAALDQIVTSEEWGKIQFSGSAATTDVDISAVFYSNPDDEAAAAGLAEKLGGVSTYTSDEYAEYDVRLVVLLGADYSGPGLEEAAQMTEGSADNATDADADAEADGEEAPARETNPDTGLEINPETGLDIDPATGWDIDPATGFPIDPATGAPTDPAVGGSVSG
ncbi:LytR C-terminal domain-containing protein [Leucobacter chromiiresistens]